MQQEQDTIGITFGIISYLRCFFSDESFQDCKVNDLKLKTLKNTSETRKMIEWIENINRYKDCIHKIVVGIYSLDIKEPHSKINNSKENVCSISNDNNNTDDNIDINKKAKRYFEEKLIEMYSFNTKTPPDFKELCKTLQEMKVLRGKFTIKLKVYTTVFVEINGFKKSDTIWNLDHLEKKEMKSFKVFTKEFRNDLTNDTTYPINERKNSLDKINCCCTINTNENQMIQCFKCNKWVHACCYGFFSSKDKRIGNNFTCYFCQDIQSKDLRDCSIYRRVLSIIYNENINFDHETDGKPTAFGENSTMNGYKQKESSSLMKNSLLQYLKSRLELLLTFLEKVFMKLKNDGFISLENRHYKIVKTREVKEKIKYYFSGRRMECLISVCDINCEIKE